MRQLELALKAAADPTRTRILKMLADDGLCVCQVQAVLGLAASTVSKHLAILRMAGLVQSRRNQKWIEYSLAGAEANPYARAVLALLRGSLERDPGIVSDRKRLRAVTAVPREELCDIARGSRSTSHGPRPPRRARRERRHV